MRKAHSMERRMQLIHDWAKDKLQVVKPEDETDKTERHTIGGLYKDFTAWSSGKPAALHIPATTFGRHIRNLAGIDVRRGKLGAIAHGVRLITANSPDPDFVPRLKLSGPNLTKLEQEMIKDRAKTQRQTALEIAVSALTMIMHADPSRAGYLAEVALTSIWDGGYGRQKIKGDQRATQKKPRKITTRVLQK